jgi:hypothetical protein
LKPATACTGLTRFSLEDELEDASVFAWRLGICMATDDSGIGARVAGRERGQRSAGLATGDGDGDVGARPGWRGNGLTIEPRGTAEYGQA